MVVSATIGDTKVVVPLNVQCPTDGLTAEIVMYIAIGRTADGGVAGTYHWLCAYDARVTSEGIQELGSIYDPDDPPPSL